MHAQVLSNGTVQGWPAPLAYLVVSFSSSRRACTQGRTRNLSRGCHACKANPVEKLQMAPLDFQHRMIQVSSYCYTSGLILLVLCNCMRSDTVNRMIQRTVETMKKTILESEPADEEEEGHIAGAMMQDAGVLMLTSCEKLYNNLSTFIALQSPARVS
jgi:hypothetical protein